MTITVKDLLDFIEDNKIPDDAVIIVPKDDTSGWYSTTIWCDPDDLSVDWDLNFHAGMGPKIFIGDI